MLSKEDRYLLIKELGGFTPEELESQKSKEYQRGRDSINKQRKKYSFGWLKSEIHRKLNIIFPPSKEFDHARYRWLKSNTLTTDHISQMNYEELMATYKHLDEMIKE